MPCNECDNNFDGCIEECGCPIQINSLACIRHSGPDLPCLDVVKGETLEAIIAKIEQKFCSQVEGLDGIDGVDGQTIDHTSFTGEEGTEGGQGQLSEYTVWGDEEETINLGTFIVYNGIDGRDVDHTSFTSTGGPVPTAGAAGQTDTYTVWADPLEVVPLGTFVVYNGNDGIAGYDSGWIVMNSYNTDHDFGFPTYNFGGLETYQHPRIRVKGGIVFLEGVMLLPLSGSQDGSTLLNSPLTYSSTQREYVSIFTGVEGGYNTFVPYNIKTRNPILPPEIAPTEKHFINRFEIITRPISDVNGTVRLTLNSIIPDSILNTDGTLQFNTIGDTNDNGTGTSVVNNSPLNMLVSVTTQGGIVPDYANYATQYVGVTDKRTSPASSTATYPSTFDGKQASQFGGFFVRLTTSYPLSKDLTVLEIQTAINKILE
jgi:hypothetical protein